MPTDKNILAKCLAQVEAFQVHLPEGSIPSHVGAEYNNVVRELETILDDDLARFKLDDQMAQPVLKSVTPDGAGGRHSNYSAERYFAQSDFLLRLNGLANYLNILLTEQPRKIGFKIE